MTQIVVWMSACVTAGSARPGVRSAFWVWVPGAAGAPAAVEIGTPGASGICATVILGAGLCVVATAGESTVDTAVVLPVCSIVELQPPSSTTAVATNPATALVRMELDRSRSLR